MQRNTTPTAVGYHDRRARRRIFAAAVVLVAALAVIASAAHADTITVNQIHPAAVNGAVAATVVAVGPADSAVAIDLFRGSCPAIPPTADYVPGLDAQGQPTHLLANPPSPGATGTFELCVWIEHEGGEIAARYQHTTALPAGATQATKRGHKHRPRTRRRSVSGVLEGGAAPVVESAGLAGSAN